MPIELSGMDELLARLQSVNRNVEFVKEVALEKGAEVFRREIRNNAPTGVKNTQSWQYRAGKKYAVEHLKDNIIISRVFGQGNKQYVNVGPEKHFFYSRFFELGTVHQRAKPFIEPAFLSKRHEALAAIKEVIEEAIRSG